MTLFEMLLVLGAAALGGALNSVAGGGSFITFPALVFVGLPPIVANATNAVALWPASLAAAVAYRRELSVERQRLSKLGALSVVGALVGAALLLRTSNATFARLVPYLLLFAAIVFSFGGPLNERLRARQQGRSRGWLVPLMSAAAVFSIAVYGGYFGGGMGILLLALLSIMGMADLHAMNAVKNALATLINLVAVVTFVFGKKIEWLPASMMMVASMAGSYAGVAAARRVAPIWIRRFVILVAWSMTFYFFLRGR